MWSRIFGCAAAVGCRPSAWKAFWSRAIGSSRKGSVEFFRVLGAVIRWQAHADEQHPDLPLLRQRHHRGQVFLHRRHRQAAQAVVGTECENHHGWLELRQSRIQPRATAGGGFAADAGVGDRRGGTVGLQALSEQGRPALADGDAEAGGKAVAENQNALFNGVRR
jgi:hypothetical protein